MEKFFHFINKIACNPNRIKLQLLLNSTISCCDSQSLFEYSEQLPLNCVVLSGQVICLLSLTSLKSQIWITWCGAAVRQPGPGGCMVTVLWAVMWRGPDRVLTIQSTVISKLQSSAATSVQQHSGHYPTIPGAVGSSVLCTQTARTAAAGVICVTRQFLPAVNSLLTACPAGWLGVTV